MKAQLIERLQKLPLGPNIKKYLAWPNLDVNDSTGSGKLEGSSLQAIYDDFAVFFIEYCMENQITRFDTFVDIVEELAAMRCPVAALKVASMYPEYTDKQDFRLFLALGVSAMSIEDFSLAESYFYQANKVVPEELAPHVNLTQMFLLESRVDDAIEWSLAGIKIDLNHSRLWELLARSYQQKFGASYIQEFEQVCRQHHSWAAHSMLSELLSPGDADLKLEYLQPFYDQGERSKFFLIEYTAVLGVSGFYQKIPTVIWQAEKLYPKDLPWQLAFHNIQAHMAMNEFSTAYGLIEDFEKLSIPSEVRVSLESLKEEAKQSLA